jgi:hypothetical protein
MNQNLKKSKSQVFEGKLFEVRERERAITKQ